MDLKTFKKLYRFICDKCDNLYNKKVEYCGKCGNQEIREATEEDFERVLKGLLSYGKKME